MNKKKVQWLLAGNPRNIDEVKKSNLASIRMRAALSLECNDIDISVKLLNNLKLDNDTNILGIGKLTLISNPEQANIWVDIIKEHKKKGGRVFIDYTDHHLRDSNKNTDIYNLYKEILSFTDYCVVSSRYLENAINKITNIKSHIIEDPLEFEICNPKDEIRSTPTGLWFGHASNLNYLFDFLISRFNPKYKTKIYILSNLYPFPDDLNIYLSNNISPNLELIVKPWNLSDMKSTASLSDFCIIPCGMGDERKEGVSSNRLITALALGLPCFADSPLSYSEFIEYFSPLNDNIINSFITEPTKYLKKTKDSQDVIKTRFSKKTIINEWHRFMKFQV